MKGVNEWISGHPKAGIGIVIAITAAMLFSMYSNGISTQMNEESFMPDMEVVNAYRDVTSNYTEQYTVQILVRSYNGDILNRDSLAEVFEVEEALLSNETVRSNLENPSYPEGNIISLPTTLAATRIVAEAFMQGMNTSLLEYYPYNITQMRKALLGKTSPYPLAMKQSTFSSYTPRAMLRNPYASFPLTRMEKWLSNTFQGR